MSSTNQPFGFRPAYHPSGIIRPTEFPNAIVSGFGTQIFIYQPVKIVGGFVQPITSSADKTIGVFAGVEYFVNNNSTVKSGSTGWPASATYDGTSMRVWIWDDIDISYEVQAQGSVAQTALYSQVLTTNITAGNVNVGQSGATVSNTTVGVGVQGQWTIYGVQQGPDNAWGDNFTILRVQQANNQINPASTSIG